MGYVCQNEPDHPDDQPEVEMVSAGPGENGVICPECGRMAAGPDDEIPYGDPPDYAPDLDDVDQLMAEYPVEALSELDRRGRERFAEKSEQYGAGRNWRDCSDGEMAKAAGKKLDDAVDLLSKNRRDEAVTALSDVCNFVAFEADNALTFADETTRRADEDGGRDD